MYKKRIQKTGAEENVLRSIEKKEPHLKFFIFVYAPRFLFHILDPYIGVAL